MKKVFIVVGSCGEYSDFRMWHVKAFMDQNTAAHFVEDLKLKMSAWKENHPIDSFEYEHQFERAMTEYMSQFDEQFDMDYGHMEYEIFDLDLEE